MSLRTACSVSATLASSSTGAARTYIRPLIVLGKQSFSTHPRLISTYPKSRLPTIASSSKHTSRTFTTSRKSLAGDNGTTADAAPGIKITDLTTSQYEEYSERDMEILNESLEFLCEDLGHGTWEVEYSSGVLNLSLPPHGHYVVNKQPPNQQIWISSPLSGPSRFGYSSTSTGEGEGVWVHHRREGVTLGGLLDKELKEIMEKSSISGGWEGTGLK